jgi:integrase
MAELRLLIESSSGRWRPLIVKAVFTGMRASELGGLCWSDLDLDAGVIHVRQRADTWANIGATKSKTGKRDIPLAPIVLKCPQAMGGTVAPSVNSISFSRMAGATSKASPLQALLATHSDQARPGRGLRRKG